MFQAESDLIFKTMKKLCECVFVNGSVYIVFQDENFVLGKVYIVFKI